MQKTTKVLGFISLVLSLFSIIVFIQHLLQSSTSDGSWNGLGFFLIAIIFLFLAIVLSIPFLIFIIKLKFSQMKFYAYTHLSFVLLSVFMFVYSLNS